ncbi:hypothetical protein B7P43_G13101 [Cryptotermes secundus]|uniref:Uncharacterized protein n=1 Tax=Cryptotermes secundus TaxID=105785 RepID=A0A2J7PE46_9NEOP|nr:hypothetical protein B7P43_G13101 [Cryptotermes secundus]
MPDVSRSDSQRSDSSRPRVSFNRDVHVKRIGSPGAPRVIGALASDGEGHLVPLPVRRERPTRLSRQELAKEAKRVLAQADSVVCSSQAFFDQSQNENKNAVNSGRKFSTLPPLRRKSKKSYHNRSDHSLGEESPSSSLERHTTEYKKSNKRLHNIDSQNVSKGSPASSLDRKSIKRSGGRNIVASVFSSLDRAVSKKNKHALVDQDVGSFQSSTKNSSSLNDLVDSSSSSPVRIKKQRIGLQRSISDAGSRKSARNNVKNKSSGVFLSLDRLTAKQRKNKNKTILIHSDNSDRSPAQPRKNILKKSYSDSESTSQTGVKEENHHLHGEGWKKKQLSPIIEVLPREDYFHEKKSPQPLQDSEKTDASDREGTMLHSSQLPAQKPTLTRGQTVDAMVKRLSQDFNRTCGPPRGVNSAPGLITPEHRQHNNNLPFSYTTPTTHQYGSSTPTVEPTRNVPLSGRQAAVSRSPTAVDGQVIYAEVVVSGGGNNGGAVSKQTVHTKVLPITQLQPEEPIQPKVQERQFEKTHFQQTSEAFPSKALTTELSQPYHQQNEVRVKVTNQPSDEDEGLGLTMEHGDCRYLMDYVNEGNSCCRKGVMDNYRSGNSYTSKGEFMEKQIRNGEEERKSQKNSSRREIRTDYSANNVRKEYILHESIYESENCTFDPSARGRADGMDSRKKDFMMSESYNGRGYDDGIYHHHNGEAWDDVRQHLLSDNMQNENYKSEFHSDARIIPPDETDGHGHYVRDRKELLSHTRDNNDLSSRRDRLESRIESQRKDRLTSNKYSDICYKGGSIDTQNEINRKFATDITSNNRHDFLKSQLDYGRSSMMEQEKRRECGKNYGLKNSQYQPSFKTESDSYNKRDLFADSGIEVDYRTKDSSTNNMKYDKLPIHNNNNMSANSNQTQKITRGELHNHSYDHISDDDDTEMDGSIHHHIISNHCSDTNEDHKTKSINMFTSTRLVQEQKHSEAIPSSTVLIRHWVPLNEEESNNLKNKYTHVSKTNAEDTQQPLLSNEEYEEYEMSGKKDEYKKEPTEEYKKTDNKEKQNEEKEEKKVTKKKQSSTIDKMRQLFMRSDKSAKKDKKKEGKVKVMVEGDEEEDPLTSRYTEYRGSDIDLHQESPRTPHRDRINPRGSNVQLEQQETPGPGHRNWRPLESGSPKVTRYMDQDTAYQSFHRGRSQHTRASNTDLDESTPRPPRPEIKRGGQPSSVEEQKVRVSILK